MSAFHSILVGVDFGQSTAGPPGTPDVVTQSAIRQAMWLAGASRATLTFFSVLPADVMMQAVAGRALADLVRQAREQGIEAGASQATGKAWLEITRKVLRDGHDLAVVGTHDPHVLRRLLLGSTARSLLHECPCAVWVSKPGPAIAPRNIVLASDLSPLSDAVVRIGRTVRELAGAHAHILDVIEYPLDRLLAPYPSDSAGLQYHRQRRAETDQALHTQAERAGSGPADPAVTIHVADGDGIPDHAIERFVDDHRIDLLVLGTSAKHGLAGVMLGNMAERLLPHVPCSVLVIKSADFHCVVC
jgi:universal stress protein E